VISENCLFKQKPLAVAYGMFIKSYVIWVCLIYRCCWDRRPAKYHDSAE